MTAAPTLRVLDLDAFLALPGEALPIGIARRPVLRGAEVTSMRASVPPGMDIPPHVHPKGKAALIFVLAGELQLGLGKAFDAAGLRRIGPAGVAVLRADDPAHFARTGDEGAEFLVIAAPPELIDPAILGAPAP